ncbi:MAG: lysylphosphatidylglycerol synthase transmembrane domain-containing protein [Bacteroidaceae bacterium]
MKNILQNALKIVLPFVLGTAILMWMYRDTPLDMVWHTLTSEMKWNWMLLSLAFGVLPQVFRGLRWRLTLAPLNETPRRRDCINAIFVSYASSLVVPRIGEITRCGTLVKQDGTSFSKALGTVVTERIIDSVLILLITGVTLLMQLPVFLSFFKTTGTNLSGFFARFTTTGYLVTLVCFVCVLVLLGFLLWRLSVFSKVKGIMLNLLAGILSLKKVQNLSLYLFYTIGIWVGYFFHFYLTFYCFEFTEHLGVLAGLVVFCVGSIAVIVPTPNGAGPWHFAVKTILVLYGVAETGAMIFALLVHTIQTGLLLVLGVYGLVALQFTKPKKKILHA